MFHMHRLGGSSFPGETVPGILLPPQKTRRPAAAFPAFWGFIRQGGIIRGAAARQQEPAPKISGLSPANQDKKFLSDYTHALMN
jgi:hypothetical protein